MSDSSIQIYSDDRVLISSQFHPELTADAVASDVDWGHLSEKPRPSGDPNYALADTHGELWIKNFVKLGKKYWKARKDC